MLEHDRAPSSTAQLNDITPDRSGTRSFLLVLIGQVASAFGSGLTSFAIAVWVYQQSRSLLQFGLVMFVNAIVTAVVAPFLGVACDRYPLRRMMLVGDCGAALLTALMLVCLLFLRLELWLLLIAVALDAVFATLHQIAYRAAIPAMVSQDRLSRANGMVETGLALSGLCAPLAAGVLIVTVGLAGIFVIDLLTFVIAAITLFFARFPQARPTALAPTTTEKSRAAPGVWQELRAGWRYLRDRRGLSALLVVVLAASFTLTGVQVLFTPMVLALHGPETLGLLTMLAGVGMLASGLFVAIDGRNGAARRLIACQALLAVCLIGLGFAAAAWLLAVCVFAAFAVSQWGSITSRTIWQSEVDVAMRGRVFAFLSASSAAVVPLANLGAAWIAEVLIKPWLDRGTGFAAVAVQWFGPGIGGAAAAMIVLFGLALLLFSVLMQRHPAWRELSAQPSPELTLESP